MSEVVGTFHSMPTTTVGASLTIMCQGANYSEIAHSDLPTFAHVQSFIEDISSCPTKTWEEPNPTIKPLEVGTIFRNTNSKSVFAKGPQLFTW